MILDIMLLRVRQKGLAGGTREPEFVSICNAPLGRQLVRERHFSYGPFNLQHQRKVVTICVETLGKAFVLVAHPRVYLLAKYCRSISDKRKPASSILASRSATIV